MGNKLPQTNRKSDKNESQEHDRCQTPPYAVTPLKPFLPRDVTVWEPASGEGLLANTLALHCRQVVRSDVLTGQNFHTWQPRQVWDMLVTNPPYSTVYDWLRRCYALGKPFALLIPGRTLFAGDAQELMQQYGYEIMFLKGRVDFKMPQQGWNGSGAQFSVIWWCWQLLPQVNMFGEINLAEKNAWKAMVQGQAPMPLEVEESPWEPTALRQLAFDAAA